MFYTVLNPDAETILKDEKGNVCCELHKKSHGGRLAYDVFLKTVPQRRRVLRIRLERGVQRFSVC